MRPVLSREQMRAFDRHAIEGCQVPSLVLMENAGRGAYEALRERISPSDRIVVVCGSGNNGGDGFVLARHALCDGFDVQVLLQARRSDLAGDASLNAQAWLGVGGRLLELPRGEAEISRVLGQATVLVDALFGTGLRRVVEGPMADLISLMNGSAARVFALDIPSGLDADSGRPLGAAVRAEVTFTFGQLKLGLLTSSARAFTGELVVVGLGVPAELQRAVGHSAECADESDVRALLARRPVPRHKGDSGRVVVFAGAPETVGAARLAAHGALRVGAGLVQVATFGEAARALRETNWEAMVTELDPAEPTRELERLLAWADAVVLGPGFGLGESSTRVMDAVVARAQCPVVLDADGITHFARNPEALRAAATLLLTPHPGEAARLLGSTSEAVEEDRLGALSRLVGVTGATVLLKGERTLIASPAEPRPTINTTGTPALATGGSGDVLSGMLAALCCHLPPRDAAVLGAWLHGRAAEHFAERHVDRGVLAHEIADQVPTLMGSLGVAR